MTSQKVAQSSTRPSKSRD